MHATIQQLAFKQAIRILKFILGTLLAIAILTCLDGIWTAICIVGIALLVYIIYHQFYYRTQDLPPGPMPWPIVGNAFSMNLTHPAKKFEEWSRQYGPVYTVWLPEPMVVIASPEALHEALIVKDKYSKLANLINEYFTVHADYPTSGRVYAGRPMGYIWCMFSGNLRHGGGLILCDGRQHEKMRAFMNGILSTDFGFGNTRIEQRIMHSVYQLTENMERMLANQEECIMDVDEPFSFCVANIIQAFIVGEEYSLDDSEFFDFKKLIDSVLEDVTRKEVQVMNSYPVLSYLYNPPLKRYIENGFALQRYFESHIERVKRNISMDGDPSCVIEAYLRHMVEHPEDEDFSELTLALTSGDMWTGGMETTVTILRWLVIYWLHNPEVQEKCYQEVVEIFGYNEPSYKEHERAKYLQATLSETLRVVNVLPFAIPHRTLEDTSVNGYEIKKGTIVLTPYGAVHLNPEHFTDPEVFRPERFLECNLKNVFYPFGSGKRSCIGEKLARYELFLISSVLLQHYKFEPIAGKPLPSLERTQGMTNKPKAYQCRVIRRVQD